MDPILLRPRKATEIVDASIEVYRRNPTHFMLVTAAVQAPWLVLQLILFGNARPGIDQLGTSALLGLGTLVSQQFAATVVVQMASDLYLGRDTDVLSALKKVAPRLIRAFIASIFQGIVIIFGLMLFLFPAVYFTALYFGVIPLIVLENQSISGAFNRSAQLSRDLKLHIVGAIGIIIAIRYAVSIGVIVLASLTGQPIVQQVAASLVAVVVNPLTGIVEALIYYDVRIRREGFDIEMMAGEGSSSRVALA
jgi:hypothetical protein